MTANDDLERIREAVTGRAGPAPYAGHRGRHVGGAQPGTPEGGKGGGKKKGRPAPLPPDPAPAPPPDPPRRPSENNGSGFLSGIAFLVAAAILITWWVNSGDLPDFGSHRPSWSSSSAPGPGPAPGTGDDNSYSAPKTLSISPQSGSTRTTVTVTGSGFIPNGRVKLTFHATAMGEVDTDGDGGFVARMRIPDPDFYGHFPNQTFSISTTEYSRDGIYQGNGPAVGFHVN